MMNLNTMGTMEEASDARLVTGSLTGNREAFGQIVARYQTLVCALAYSGTGDLGQSEDLAQETFVAAWKQLGHLREPDKLRSWLCQITRNLTYDALKQQGREPSHAAETLDTVHESPAPGPQPHDLAMSHEEQAILWRSLGGIPEIYREPLVLFYRENQSIKAVAQNLELSEDVVKQRLSRGRKLLHEQVLAFVEGALGRTNPGKAFTLAVLAALPAFTLSAKAATMGATAAKGSAAAKAAAGLGLFGAFFAPFIGILAGVLGTRISIDSARSPRERQFKIRMAWLNWSLLLAYSVLFSAGIFFAGPAWMAHPVWFTWAMIGASFGYGLLIVWLAIWSIKYQRRMSLAIAAHSSAGAAPNGSHSVTREYRSRWTFLGWPLIHVRFGEVAGQRLPARGWIACGSVAYGILFASGGVAVGTVSMGGIAIGAVAIGGCAVGPLAFGGIAMGLFAVGGAALGYMACGGAAIAWLVACGGAAVAHYYALGAVVLAPHANDGVARAFVRNSALFSCANLFRNLGILLSCLSLIPGLLYWRRQSRRS